MLVPQRIRIDFAGHTIADSTRAVPILDAAQHPTYYIPKQDFLRGILVKSEHTSVCPLKGHATYWSIDLNGRFSENAAWSYEDPNFGYEQIRGLLAVYPHRVDACRVEQLEPQSSQLTSPIK